ncbi:MAG TPA: discoidin domain-containing protein [Streptosporangiaceae bacterium]|nr:discoidin domain-containing protein [Streptosporangiaceae bacterium]
MITVLALVFAYVNLGSPAIRPDLPGNMYTVGNHMTMLTATTADSYTPLADPLPESKWTVTASDQAAGHPASDAIDGNNDTFWMSNVHRKLPHWITINLHAVEGVSGLTYLPRQDSSHDGDIGQYSISVSMNGTSWSAPVTTGTWADDKKLKTAEFGGVRARYVRLTALTEAGNRGPWTTAAEIGLLTDPPTGPPLPRTGWTATADSSEAGQGPREVLDGDGLTMWQTAWTGDDIPPYPHWITINMHATHVVTGLAYLPRQDGNPNGTIGRYSVSVSMDGVNWSAPVASGKWADDATQKYAVFAARKARYVRLTALSEAGNRGPWASAAEINILGQAPSVAAGGKWSPVIGFPLIPVSAVMLPNDKILTFSAVGTMDYTMTMNTVTNVAVLDLKTGKVSEPIHVHTHHQMFCEGLALLANGSVLINGGSNDRATTIYNPYTNKWTIGPLMNIPRAYNSTTTLSTGQAFTIGGSWYDWAGHKNGEIFTPKGASGSWRRLPKVLAGTTLGTGILTDDPAGVYRADNHAWLFAQANGTVFQAGPSKQMNWITTKGKGSITGAGHRGSSKDAMNGNAVLYAPGKILTLGGAIAYQDAGSVVDVQATRRAYVVNITAGPGKPAKTYRTSNMAYQRSFSNSVVLPNGEVLVVGGQQHPQTFTDTGAVLSPELWNPVTGKFTIMAPEAIPRTYHSTALLLPDGRVFSGGGGLCGNGCTANHPDGQIFSPPYLFNANGTLRQRPSIKSAPAKAKTGTTITVTTNSSTPSFALIRMGAATHAIDNDQRRIPLTPVTNHGDTYTLRLPASTGILLPGNYMLFALNSAGTPSVAKIINIR